MDRLGRLLSRAGLGGALAAALVGAAPAAAGELPWAVAPSVSTTATGVLASTAADLDGDGVLDVAVAAAGAGSLFWYAGSGAGLFGAAQLVAAGAPGVRAVASGDLDGDGDLDLAAGAAGGGLGWYENAAGDGSLWTPRALRASAPGAGGVAIADVDGDGDLDVVGCAADDDRVSWFENPGSLAPFAEHPIALDPDGPGPLQGFSDGPVAVAVGDVDGDGAPDVLVASSADDTFAWYRNSAGDGSAWSAAAISTAAAGAASVQAADVDGDGRLDAVAASSGDASVRWFRNAAGDGSSWVAGLVSGIEAGARAVAARDLDADGDADVLSAAAAGGGFAWHENTAGDGSAWTRRPLPAAGSGPAAASAADLDRDGDLDVLVALEGDDRVAWVENLRLHRSAALANETVLSASAVQARAVAAADLDRDGDLDLLAVSSLDGDVVAFENLGGGSFSGEQLIDGNASAPYGVNAADLDGDGDPDLLLATAGDDSVTWSANDGLGAFGARQLIASDAGSVRSAVAGDLDRDGDLDVASAAKLDDEIHWYENTAGDGSAWTTHLVTASADDVVEVAMADVDGDGDLDLLAASQSDDTIAWYENDGLAPPGFAKRVVTEDPDGAGPLQGFANGAHGVAAADLDRDGDLDLLSVSAHDDRVAWYENAAGDGSVWATHLISSQAKDARAVAVADLDGDGDVDALSASKDDRKVAWYENAAGDGSLWSEHAITTDADKAFDVIAADLDGDGDVDVAAAARDDNEITWYENRGGSVALAGSDVAPAVALEGQAHAVLALDVAHRGRAGEGPLELTGLTLRFEEPAGVPLGATQASALMASLAVYRDDGSGSFEPGLDALAAPAIVPGLVAGEDEVAFVDGDPAAAVPAGTTARFFAVVTLQADAAGKTPAAFDLIVSGEDGLSAEDASADLPLALEVGPDASARLAYVATLTSDADGDGLPDVVETQTGVFVSPTDTGSDPFDADSDDDGVSDGIEVTLGTNPNRAPTVPGPGGLAGLALGLALAGLARRGLRQ